MTIILTMAGAGSRFRTAGYDREKYAIDFRGHSLFEWSLASLIRFRDAPLVVVTRRFDGVEPFVRDVADRLGFRPPQFVHVDAVTRGQAESAALARSLVPADRPALVYNTDTFVQPSAWRPDQIRGDGWIPCFTAPGDKWSFVEADADGRARRVTEKVRISDQCSVGLYWFARFGDLLDALPAPGETDGEWYIAPLYNRMIAAGRAVYLHTLPSDAVCVLGTPEDLAAAPAALAFPDPA